MWLCLPVQTYSAVFDASVETVPQNQPKGRSLTFEVTGEGNLPHVIIAKPTLRNKRGQPLLVFQQCVVGRSQTLPVVIVNDGTLTCKVRPCRPPSAAVLWFACVWSLIYLWPPIVMGRPLCFAAVVSMFFFSFSSFFSLPMLSGWRLDVYQTSRHDVALVRI